VFDVCKWTYYLSRMEMIRKVLYVPWLLYPAPADPPWLSPYEK